MKVGPPPVLSSLPAIESPNPYRAGFSRGTRAAQHLRPHWAPQALWWGSTV